MGTDPEFVILGPTGKPVPAHRFFPGKDKKMTFSVKLRGNGYIFRDGYSVEINVPPSYCRSVLTDSVKFMLVKAQQQLPKGHHLAALPAWKIELSDVKRAPYDVRIFGCDPSLNAYTGEEQRVELDGASHPLRYGGGHMHFSEKPAPDWMKDYKKVCHFVKLMDAYVGLPLTYLFDGPLTFARRQHYGRAGEFRLQNYPDKSAGIEYRTPDPRIWNNQVIAMMAFGVGRHLFERMSDNPPALPFAETTLQRVINTGVDLRDIKPLRGWYTSKTLAAAKGEKAFQKFQLGKPYMPSELDYDLPNLSGWREWRGACAV